MNNQNFLQWTLAHEQEAPEQQLPSLSNGTEVEIWDTGVIAFIPQHPNQTDIVISCGIHGNETAPIELVDALIEDIRAERLTLRSRVLFIIGNPPAINIAKRFVEENLNRLFSGTHSKGPGLINAERQRAKRLESYVERFFLAGTGTETETKKRTRIHYDLHTAIRTSIHEKFAIYPHQDGRLYERKQFQLIQAMGVDTVLLHDGPATTFSYYSVHHFQAQAFTVELGQVKPFGQNDMSKFQQTQDMLTQLLEEKLELPVFEAERMSVYQVRRNVLRTQEDFRLEFAEDVSNFTSFPLGYVLAYDGDKAHKIEIEGEAVVFPNAQVALGQRAILTVIPVAFDVIQVV